MKLSTGLMVLSLLVSPLFAQEAVDQKTYLLAQEGNPLPVKESFRATNRMTMADAQIEIEFGEKKINGTLSNSDSEDVTYHFASEDVIRIEILQRRSVNHLSLNKEADRDIDPSEGKTILLEKKEGKWVAKLEKGQVEEAAQERFNQTLKKFEKKFNEGTDSSMYGTKPRKIGESWKVDPKLLPGMSDYDVSGGEVTMTFLEVKEFQGEACAILKTSFQIKAKMTEGQMKGMGVTFAGDARTVRSLAFLADYKFSGKMVMDMSGEMEVQPGMSAKMSMTGEMLIDRHTAKISKKAE